MGDIGVAVMRVLVIPSAFEFGFGFEFANEVVIVLVMDRLNLG